MPWIVKAPSISAIVALPGMPSVSVGMNAHCAAPLFAASGPATPSIAPFPKAADAALVSFFSSVYDENAAIVGPAAGQGAEERAKPGPAQDRPE